MDYSSSELKLTLNSSIVPLDYVFGHSTKTAKPKQTVLCDGFVCPDFHAFIFPHYSKHWLICQHRDQTVDNWATNWFYVCTVSYMSSNEPAQSVLSFLDGICALWATLNLKISHQFIHQVSLGRLCIFVKIGIWNPASLHRICCT